MFILLVIVILIAVGIGFFLQEKTVEAPVAPEAPLIVGGDQDEHGCIGSAGYVWCESKGECLRPFEPEWDETCGPMPGAGETLNNNNEEEAIFCTMDAKICEDGSAVGRVAPDCEFEKCPEEISQ